MGLGGLPMPMGILIEACAGTRGPLLFAPWWRLWSSGAERLCCAYFV